MVGFYRYARNPMYVGFFVGWLSLWVVFGRANLAAVTVRRMLLATGETLDVTEGGPIGVTDRSVTVCWTRMDKCNAEVQAFVATPYSAPV